VLLDTPAQTATVSAMITLLMGTRLTPRLLDAVGLNPESVAVLGSTGSGYSEVAAGLRQSLGADRVQEVLADTPDAVDRAFSHAVTLVLRCNNPTARARIEERAPGLGTASAHLAALHGVLVQAP
jgi:hypothetical protein